MGIKPEDVKVRVETSPGYEKEFTEACLSVLEQMDRHKELIQKAFEKEAETA